MSKRLTPSGEQEKLDWLRLIRSQNVGPITFWKLLAKYGSAGKALKALPELAKRGGRKLQAFPLTDARKEYQALQKIGGFLRLVGLGACRGQGVYVGSDRLPSGRRQYINPYPFPCRADLPPKL